LSLIIIFMIFFFYCYCLRYGTRDDLGKFDEVVTVDARSANVADADAASLVDADGASEAVPAATVSIAIENAAFMHVVGTEMDFVEDDLRAEFVFTNPNAKGMCGCGESFNTG
jgi:Fe-S cluster assembly iron-binding protein IscA